MRLTIIPSDKSVAVDGDSKRPLIWEGTPDDVHALQWYEVSGDIELKNPTRNESITELPQWALNAVASWEVGPIPEPIPTPPPPTKEDNKRRASSMLADSDWTTIPDVADPTKSNPYLSNVNDFVVYRNAVRAIAINPPDGEVDWPIKPPNLWM